MFDYEKLDVYAKAKLVNKDVLRFIRNTTSIDKVIKDQLRRASISTILNIAEGAGRFSKPEKKVFTLEQEVLFLNVLPYLRSYTKRMSLIKKYIWYFMVNMKNFRRCF